MSAPVRVALKGVLGRMGRRIAALLEETPGAVLSAALEKQGSAGVGRDLAEAAGVQTKLPIGDDLSAALDVSDVLIDFTVAPSTLADIETYARAGKAVVIGTTGFTPEESRRIRETLAPIPYVLAPNMSVGVNVLFNLVRQAAQALGDDYDVEIIEAHHRFKKDAPSGTAVRLGEVAAEALGREYPGDAVFGREGMVGERTPKEIGMQVVRAGDIVGDHTVLFGALGERLELVHRAHSRDTFARGAIRAALWLHGKPVGGYDMQDVLGLRAPRS
jgi:4-hydroxy-tetrahydrodipicolinate reductase